jgi:hypothetical protein
MQIQPITKSNPKSKPPVLRRQLWDVAITIYYRCVHRIWHWPLVSRFGWWLVERSLDGQPQIWEE